MSIERKKISLEKFEKYSRQILALVNSRNIEVVVYNEDGPVARLIPYAAAPMGIVKERTVKPMDLGGVWYIDEETQKRLAKAKRRRKFRGFSLGGVWKLARISAILPFLARAYRSLSRVE